ncbi:MAG: lytic transglycosylase domain-containing protein [Burkholderiaceae bacterium]|nr:lytic transglycosylase domain-containing protein [Burkholderiaceae bacterium]
MKALSNLANMRLQTVDFGLQTNGLLTQGLKKISQGLRLVARDTANGFIEITQNGFALLGLAFAIVSVVLLARPDLRLAGETELLGWLQSRHSVFASIVPASADTEEVAAADLDASDRATATDPADLPKQQAAVAFWLSKKYRVAPEPISALVAEAYAIGTKAKLDPTLILAIMAIESGFNPFAQSPVGAQGLMQVMTKIHSDKYEGFGGKLAAFDPLTNLRVGVKVLQESISRAGSIEGGLKHYVGAANMEGDGGYTSKVIAEYSRLHQVATGRPAPMRASTPAKTAQPANQPVIVPTAAPATPAVGASSEKIASLVQPAFSLLH